MMITSDSDILVRRKELEDELIQHLLQQTGRNDIGPDHMLFDAMMDQWVNYKTAQLAIKTDGFMTISHGREGTIKKAHPAIAVADKSLSSLVALMREFRLTPTTRAELSDDDDGWTPGQRPGIN